MNFKNQRFITRGVGEKLSPLLILFLWELIDNLSPPMDYLQVFNLSEKDGKLRIEHVQEKQEYRREYLISTGSPVCYCGKIYVIDDETHSTMLLASEY